MNNSNDDDGHFLEPTELTTLPEIKPQGQQEQRTSKVNYFISNFQTYLVIVLRR